MIKSFEEAITSSDFQIEDYCGTSYAASLLGLSVATVQSLVEKGEIEAWKTMGGHRRIALHSINTYLEKNRRSTLKLSAEDLGLRVLIVEDDEATRDLFQHEFDAWDLPIDCTVMASGLEAMMDIASMRPDLLITDLVMPGVDGFELLKAMKRNVELIHMQVVVITGLPAQAFEVRGGLPEGSFLLSKPINFDWLQGFMTAMVASRAKYNLQTKRNIDQAVYKPPARSTMVRNTAVSKLVNKLKP